MQRQPPNSQNSLSKFKKVPLPHPYSNSYYRPKPRPQPKHLTDVSTWGTPLLTTDEISLILSTLGIKISKEQLIKPTREISVYFFKCFVEIFLGIEYNNLINWIEKRCEIDEIKELEEERLRDREKGKIRDREKEKERERWLVKFQEWNSILGIEKRRKIRWFGALVTQMMKALGIEDFEWQEVFEPISLRFRKRLSTLINYVRFQESCALEFDYKMRYRDDILNRAELRVVRIILLRRIADDNILPDNFDKELVKLQNRLPIERHILKQLKREYKLLRRQFKKLGYERKEFDDILFELYENNDYADFTKFHMKKLIVGDITQLISKVHQLRSLKAKLFKQVTQFKGSSNIIKDKVTKLINGRRSIEFAMKRFKSLREKLTHHELMAKRAHDAIQLFKAWESKKMFDKVRIENHQEAVNEYEIQQQVEELKTNSEIQALSQELDALDSKVNQLRSLKRNREKEIIELKEESLKIRRMTTSLIKEVQTEVKHRANDVFKIVRKTDKLVNRFDKVVVRLN